MAYQTPESRQTHFERKSKETEIRCRLNIDGTGETRIQTQIGFLDHMLELFAFHGYFDLDLSVQKADLQIDIHHTNEDIGIVLGKTFKQALKDKQGIRRFGSGFAPMESTVGHTVIDISGRGYFSQQPDQRTGAGRVFPVLHGTFAGVVCAQPGSHAGRGGKRAER